jgi:hypothetical protein
MRVERIATVLFAAALLGAGMTGCDGETGGSGGTGGGNGGNGGSGGNTMTSSTTGSTVSTTSSSTSAQPGAFLGLSCASDAQCGAGGKCIQVTDNDPFFGGGGPAGGYCTLPCMTDSECGIGNVCFYSDSLGKGECIRGCVHGEPPLMYLNDDLDPDKCHGREDVRCAVLQDGSEVCLPTCGSDSQCDGRSCDPLLAVCVDKPKSGKALGETCDPMAADPGCAGVCITIGNGDASKNKYMCTSPCVMGGVVEGSDDCGGIEKGICIYSPQGTGVGDSAFCAESCKTQEACQTPNFWCYNINVQATGVCLDATPCTKDSECTFTDAECIATKLGKFCMSPSYPLGSLAPDGTGGAGGGTGGAGGGTGGMGGAGGSGGAGGAGGAGGG